MKNNRIRILYILLLITAVAVGCSNKPHSIIIETPHISLEIDTTRLQADITSPTGFIFKDQVYVYPSKTEIIQFDKQGDILEHTELPGNMCKNKWGLSYAVNQDSLFAIYERSVYVKDKDISQFHFIDKTEITVFEDYKYRIIKSAIKHGEILLFIDKETNKKHSAFFYNILQVNEFEGKYYVTDNLGYKYDFQTFEIENPVQLSEYNDSISPILVKGLVYPASNSNEVKYLTDDANLFIAGTFIHKDKLLLLANDNRGETPTLHISEGINGILEHRYTFDSPMRAKYLYKDEGYDFASLELEDDEDKTKFAIMRISNEKINIHFFNCEVKEEKSSYFGY